MTAQLRPALVLLGLFTVLTGAVYPALVTGVAQLFMPWQASGSLVVAADGEVLGSELVGQPWDEPRYFWGRPSATGRVAYDAAASTGTNLGPTTAALRGADPGNDAPVPLALVTASASGLAPHVTPAAALYQVPRVARARGLDEADVRELVEAHVEGRWLGILGEARVNVLRLNLALDRLDRRA